MSVRPFKEGRSLYVRCRRCGGLVGGLLPSLRDHLREHDTEAALRMDGLEVLAQFDDPKNSRDGGTKMTTINLSIKFPDTDRPAYDEQMREAFRSRMVEIAASFTKSWDVGDVTVEDQQKPIVVVEVAGGLVDYEVYPTEDFVNVLKIDWDVFEDGDLDDIGEYFKNYEAPEAQALIQSIPDEGHRKRIMDTLKDEREQYDATMADQRKTAYEKQKAVGTDP